MKKYIVLLSITFIWSNLFLILALNENNTPSEGLEALTSLGNFVLYAALSVVGIIVFIIGLIKYIVYIKRNKNK